MPETWKENHDTVATLWKPFVPCWTDFYLVPLKESCFPFKYVNKRTCRHITERSCATGIDSFHNQFLRQISSEDLEALYAANQLGLNSIWVFRDRQSIYNKAKPRLTLPCSCFTSSYFVFGSNVLDRNSTAKLAGLPTVHLQRKSFKCSTFPHSVFHGSNFVFSPHSDNSNDLIFPETQTNFSLVKFLNSTLKIWTKSAELSRFWSKGRYES